MPNRDFNRSSAKPIIATPLMSGFTPQPMSLFQSLKPIIATPCGKWLGGIRDSQFQSLKREAHHCYFIISLPTRHGQADFNRSSAKPIIATAIVMWLVTILVGISIAQARSLALPPPPIIGEA
ncbi:hypothetical protein [Reticulibacter mediterranei]|uniref:hypothetical protein n=1 Tax=Reticulibacter mediterranei TaxID=2778369 RepID=UPI001C68753A|nr:hypothetical protein [Reticulibacter mediterranei]